MQRLRGILPRLPDSARGRAARRALIFTFTLLAIESLDPEKQTRPGFREGLAPDSGNRGRAGEEIKKITG
ncbi:MAG: hypothetical protein HY784_17000 [Chloroflexi bacterium]|nr:hypothetical protein [Chloroflexota bacterium]